MKKILVFLLIVIVAISMIGCGGNSSSEEKTSKSAETSKTEAKTEVEKEDPDKYDFAIVKGAVHPYFDPWGPASAEAAKDLGIPEPIVQAPQHWDQNEQNEVLDGLVARGVKAIAMFPTDAAAGNEQITKMVDSGIPVVTIGGSPETPSKANFCAATDVAASAYEGTKHVIEGLNGKGGKIVHLAGMLTDPNTQKRMDAVQKACDEFDNVELIQTIADLDVAEPAQNAISSLMAAKRTEIDGIICTAYIPSMVAAQQLMQLKEDRIIAVGIDTDPAVLQAIKDGFMYGTMSQNPYGQAYIGIFSLKLLADGYTWKSDAPFFVDSGSFFVDKSSADNVEAGLVELTKTLLVDWQAKYFDAK